MIFEKPFDWNEEKNQKLIKERGIGFESVLLAIEQGKVLDVLPHPSLKNQKILIVEINEYPVLVPFVEEVNRYFLKTAYHSRKALKNYKSGEQK